MYPLVNSLTRPAIHVASYLGYSSDSTRRFPADPQRLRIPLDMNRTLLPILSATVSVYSRCTLSVYSVVGHCVDVLSVYSLGVLSRRSLSSMDQTASLYRPAASFCAIKTFHQYLIRICLRIGQNFP